MGSGGDSSIFTTKTPILGLRLYVIIAATVLIMISFFLIIFIVLRSKRRRRRIVKHSSGHLPLVLKEITDIPRVKPNVINEFTKKNETATTVYYNKEQQRLEHRAILKEEEKEGTPRAVDFELEGKKASSESNNTSSTSRSESSSAVSGSTEGLNIGWGRWYSLKELETATDRFSHENVIGEGGYGVVYRGLLPDGSVVAVKSLLNNKGQAEKEFKVEVEAIGKVRHKNLVGLVGYCAEGSRRLLVYEYVDNGNLEQWLHGDVGPVSPLTWDIRMKIAIGTARGLAYLHEGLEPKVVHRDVKSSNILLDRKWNPRVSDFGLAKLLGSEKSYVTTRVMGTFGYVSPDYASTGMLNEGSDVYSFGILLMELVTGRTPVDYSRTPGEMNLVDWFKGMVASRRGEEMVDPLIEVKPAPRSLKRVLLVCLRCIDLDPAKRPKMGQVVHMLEADEFPFRTEPRSARETAPIELQASSVKDIVPLAPKAADGDYQNSRWR